MFLRLLVVVVLVALQMVLLVVVILRIQTNIGSSRQQQSPWSSIVGFQRQGHGVQSFRRFIIEMQL